MAIGAYRMATRHHAIVTRMSALQDIASMDVLCSDKTGTLTTAKMSINLDLIWPAADAGFDLLEPASEAVETPEATLQKRQHLLLLMAVVSANADKKDDAIDGAVLRAFDQMDDQSRGEPSRARARFEQVQLTGFDPEVKRTVARVRRKADGRKIVVAKGLATKIMDTSSGGKDTVAQQWR
jgi:H+-transporting ATPase